MLQILDEDHGNWVNEAYVIEDDTGRIEFRYNTLTWGRVGASLNQQIQKENIPLEEIETVVPPDHEARWLAIEIIDSQPLAEAMTALDDACQLPKPRPIAVAKPIVA